MASSAERFEDEHALPRPELNPLLNPLLADNMGRWAEVYFTSPPEKREEAVLELLRELQARNSNREGPPAEAIHAVNTGAPATFESATSVAHSGDLQRCDSCGHHNPAGHQFCGMCGAQLGRTASEDLSMDRPHPRQDAETVRAEAPAYAESNSEYREPIEQESLPPAEVPRRDPYDLSPFQSLLERENPAHLGYDDLPASRYRYYIGAVLAILILALGYAAWRASRSDQNALGAPPPPPPAATDSSPAASPNVAAPAPANTSKVAEPQPTAAANTATKPTTPMPVASPKQTETAARGMYTPAANVSGAPASADNVQQSLPGSGADEFAMAQRYLRGSSGQAPDSAEAAKWLWKSIAKHNGPAMLELADLYLKGDGVPKSCDQARVLLDSAGRRGMAGAAERLRNLQAFGCQ